ncbi:glycosyltransferase family 2 protein [Aquirufa lenticrescens]
MDSNLPKISIITPSFNQGEFIEECITSVLLQNYSNFEHIIYDANSTDGTISILNKYSHLKWVSEKDNGQSDALNKALNIASGEIIGWLNADDYYTNGTFNLVVEKFRLYPNSKWLAGKLYFKIDEINALKYWEPVILNYRNLLNNCDILRTQATFIKREVYDAVGNFDENLHMVMDYDMWLRIAKMFEPLNINKELAVFRIHKNQKTTPKNLIKQYNELIPIMFREGAIFGIMRKSILVILNVVKLVSKRVLIYFKVLKLNNESSLFNMKNILTKDK